MVEGRRRIAAPLATAAILLALAASSTADAAEPDPAAAMYSPDSVVAIDLTMPEASMEALEAEPPSDEYQEGTFSLATGDGTPGGIGQFSPPLTVGIRLKGGNGSFRPLSEKAAFKIKFNFVKGQKFLGLKKLTLNNMVQDPSMVHETLGYEVFRALDIPASRTGYAFVRLNGLAYGVYLNLETLDDVSLPRWFESTQHLYEADAPGTDVSLGSAEEFEVDEGDEEDRSDLEALIAAANDGEGDWSDGMAAVADLDEMARMWAVERYIGHWDGYAGLEGLFRPNNYYLHSLDSGVFRMMPWGTDQTWEVPVEFGEPAGGLLFNKCRFDASCGALYEDSLGEVESVVPGLGLDAQAICTAELLAPWQALEDPERREYDAEEIEEGVADARTFISLRPAELAEWLGTEAPDVPSGEGPCPEEEGAPPPTQERPVVSPAPSVSPPPLGLRLRRVALDGRWLKARVVAPAPGGLRLRARTLGRNGSTVCAARREVAAAGSAALACRLSRAASRTLEVRALRLRIEVASLAEPAPGSVSRTVSLGRR